MGEIISDAVLSDLFTTKRLPVDIQLHRTEDFRSLQSNSTQPVLRPERTLIYMQRLVAIELLSF